MGEKGSKLKESRKTERERKGKARMGRRTSGKEKEVERGVNKGKERIKKERM